MANAKCDGCKSCKIQDKKPVCTNKKLAVKGKPAQLHTKKRAACRFYQAKSGKHKGEKWCDACLCFYAPMDAGWHNHSGERLPAKFTVWREKLEKRRKKYCQPCVYAKECEIKTVDILEGKKLACSVKKVEKKVKDQWCKTCKIYYTKAQRPFHQHNKRVFTATLQRDGLEGSRTIKIGGKRVKVEFKPRQKTPKKK